MSKFTFKIFFRKFCETLWKRILLLMKIPTEDPFRYAGTHNDTI